MKSNNNEQQHAIYVGKKSLTLTNLSAAEYAEAIQLSSILTQTTRIFLRKNNLSPQQSIQQYLSQSNKGQHVLLKSFGSFNKSTMNRICFLYNFIKIFQLDNHQRNGLDYYQLFRLLCSDFPKDIVVKSVCLVNDEQNATDFTKILNSRKFINALYLNLIHTQYLEAMYNDVFENKNQKVSITLLAEWLVQKQKSTHKLYDKPLFSSAIQSILNQIRKKSIINQISSNHNFPSMKDSNNKKIIFLNQNNYLQYIRTQCPYGTSFKKINNNKNQSSDSQNSFDEQPHLNSKKVDQQQQAQHYKISYEQFLKQLINQAEYHKWIKQNLQMFQNSIIWAVETYKILSPKQNGQPQQPLNQKKMKKK